MNWSIIKIFCHLYIKTGWYNKGFNLEYDQIQVLFFKRHCSGRSVCGIQWSKRGEYIPYFLFTPLPGRAVLLKGLLHVYPRDTEETSEKTNDLSCCSARLNRAQDVAFTFVESNRRAAIFLRFQRFRRDSIPIRKSQIAPRTPISTISRSFLEYLTSWFPWESLLIETNF